MNCNVSIDNRYAALLLIEILYEKGVINKQTYFNAQKRFDSHISHAA